MVKQYYAKLQSFVVQSKRVWQVLRKPTNEEFWTVSKISALGLLVIGAIGFAVSDLIKILSGIF